MSETDRLRDLLERAAPAHPDLDPTTRAATVARRGRAARTRNRVLVPVAVAAVVAVAVAIPISLGGGDGPDQATPAPPAPIQVEPCPAKPMESLEVVPSLGGVEAVRSCPVDWPSYEPLPPEPLTGEHAQAFVNDVLALPRYDLPSFCMVANIAPQPWALQAQTADGELLMFGSTMRMCSSVRIEGVERGVGEVVAAFEGNLARQQSGVPELACPTGKQLADGAATWNASFDPATATAGMVCYRGDPMGSTDYDITEASLDANLLAAIKDDLATSRTSTPGEGMCIDTGPQRMVLLEDADGDQAAWVDDRCTGEFAGPGGYWTPGQTAEQAYADALNR